MAADTTAPLNQPSLLDQLLADQPGGVPMDALMQEEKKNEDLLDRDPPDPPESRKELVSQWADKVKRAKKYWEPVFNRMKADQDFAAGYQWSKEEKRRPLHREPDPSHHRPAGGVLLRQEPQIRSVPASAHSEHGVGQRTNNACLTATVRQGRDLAASGGGRDGPDDDGAAGATTLAMCPSCKTPPGSSRKKSSSARLAKRLNFCSGPTSTPRRKTSSR